MLYLSRFFTFLSSLWLLGSCTSIPSMGSQETPYLIYLFLIISLLASSLILRYRNNFPTLLKHAGIWFVIIIVITLLYQLQFSFSGSHKTLIGAFSPSTPVSNSDHSVTIHRSNDGHFYVTAKINNYPIRFVVDTGATDIVLSIDDAKRLGIYHKDLKFNKPYHTANGMVFGASVKLDKLEVGPIIIYNSRASINKTPLQTSLLGMEFLSQLERYEVSKNTMTFIAPLKAF